MYTVKKTEVFDHHVSRLHRQLLLVDLSKGAFCVLPEQGGECPLRVPLRPLAVRQGDATAGEGAGEHRRGGVETLLHPALAQETLEGRGGEGRREGGSVDKKNRRGKEITNK